jgi:adenine specific DNA methylase Mod
VIKSGNTDASDMLRAMRSFLKENDMMAYLAMMAVRLIELHRVLKPTGSLYLHCDPTASHYLKILLDAIFGKDRFLNEIIWKRRSLRKVRRPKAAYAPSPAPFHFAGGGCKFFRRRETCPREGG